MQGRTVGTPMTSIRLFVMCEQMKWAHLPWPGGLYDQHPDLLDQFMYIFQERSKQQEKERKQQEAETKRKQAGAGRTAGARRR